MRPFVQRNLRSILALIAILISLIAPAHQQTAVGSGRPSGGYQSSAKKAVSGVTIGARLARYTTHRATTARVACEATVYLAITVVYKGRTTWAHGQTLTFAPGRGLRLPATVVKGKKKPKSPPKTLRLAVPRPKHGRASLDVALLVNIVPAHGKGASHARTEMEGQAQLLSGRKSLGRVTLRVRAALTCAAARKPTPSPSSGASGPAGSTVQVSIMNFAFSPATIAVASGTTVVWTNGDTAAHTVTAADGSWTSPSLAKGARYSRIFNTPGTYNYICAIHPYMKGTVIVTRPAGASPTAAASAVPSSPTVQSTPAGPQPPPATTITSLPGATTAAVTIAHFAFTPQTLTVPAGTSVTWTNQDAVAHTATADDGSWDSGSLAQGSSYTRRFDTPGTYTYHCAIHPYMTGTIVVLAAPGAPPPPPPPPATSTPTAIPAPPTATSPPPPPGATATPTQVVPLNASVSIVSQSAGFSPKVVTIQVGGTVTWTNTDGIAHSVAAADFSWYSDSLQPGATYSYTFNVPGTYNYICGIHPFMTGTVIVVPPPGSTDTPVAAPPPATDTATQTIVPPTFKRHQHVNGAKCDEYGDGTHRVRN